MIIHNKQQKTKVANTNTLPETNIFAPGSMDGWKVFLFPFGANRLFSRGDLVSFRECI